MIFGIYIFTFFLMLLILIFFSSYCIESYKNKYCEENNRLKLEKIGKRLYFCSAIVAIISSIIFEFFCFESVKIFIGIIPVIIVGISLICKAFGKNKIANILCGFIIVSIFIGIFVFGIYGFFALTSKNNRPNTVFSFEQQFNFKFTQYEGDIVKSSTVNTMIQAVIANNISQDDSCRQVEIEFKDFDEGELKDSSGNIVTKISKNDTVGIKVGNNSTYKVSCLMKKNEHNEEQVYLISVTKNNTEPIRLNNTSTQEKE